MFDIGFPELIVIAIVALVVLGPEQLPSVLWKFGRFVGSLKQQFNVFHDAIDKTVFEQQLEEHKKNQVADIMNGKPPYDVADILPSEKPPETNDENKSS